MNTSSTDTNARPNMKVAYMITENKQGKSFWTRIGVGFVNRDNSINIQFEAFPTSGGKIQLRDWEPRDEMAKPGDRPLLDAPPRETFAA